MQYGSHHHSPISTGRPGQCPNRNFECRTNLFEFPLSRETIETMLGAGSPSDTVVGIKVDARPSLFLVNNLQSIVVDEHVCRATLQFIGGDCLFDGSHRGHNDGLQPFLVDRTLNRDMGKGSVLDTRRAVCREEFGVLGHLANRTNALCETADNDLGEKLKHVERIRHIRPRNPYQGEEHLNRGQREKGESKIALVNGNLDGNRSATGP